MLAAVLPVAPGGTAHVSAPGQLPQHYAPTKPVRLEAISRGGDEWLIGYGAVRGDDWLGDDPVAAAARLLVSEAGGYINGQMIQVNGGGAT